MSDNLQAERPPALVATGYAELEQWLDAVTDVLINQLPANDHYSGERIKDARAKFWKAQLDAEKA